MRRRRDRSAQEAVRQEHGDAQDAHNSQGPAPETPIQRQSRRWEAHDARNVAEPDQASPNVLGSMRREDQKQIFGRGRLHGMAGDRDRDCPLEQCVHVEINGIKARLNRPLHLEKVRVRRRRRRPIRIRISDKRVPPLRKKPDAACSRVRGRRRGCAASPAGGSAGRYLRPAAARCLRKPASASARPL